MWLWLARICLVMALVVAASILARRPGSIHPVFRALQRTRGSQESKGTTPSLWKRILAFVLIVIAFLLCVAMKPIGDFKDSVDLRLQIALDQRGFSPNCIDGTWGAKTESVLATWCEVNGMPMPAVDTIAERKSVCERLFKDTVPFREVTVTADDVNALVVMPITPKDKSVMKSMGYATLQEMFAERGHMSQKAIVKLNPALKWPNPPIGSVITIPNVSDEWPRVDGRRVNAGAVRVSISRCEVTVFDDHAKLVALFPCSIAADKKRRPNAGVITIVTMAPKPNYTYTPEDGKSSKLILPPGPNNPVGSAWIGLSLPTYGIHGTPTPETIGNAESHGCFRLANWNARRLFSLVSYGLPVEIVD